MTTRISRPALAPEVVFACVLALLPVFTASIAHAQQSLYWIETSFSAPKLGRANPDGTNRVTTPLTAGSLPEGLALDAASSRLYWTESAWSGANVNRIGANLSSRTALVAGEFSMHGIALDVPHGNMYWTSSNLVVGPAIERANLDGTGHVVIEALPPGSNPRGIVLDAANSSVIWADYDLGTISACGLNGGAITEVATELPGIWGLALDTFTGQLFLSNYIYGTIQQALPPYGTFTDVVTSLGNPTYVAVDPSGGKVYWSEAGAGAQKIQRANYDGTLVQNLGIPTASFGGLAVGDPVVADVPLPPDFKPVTEFAMPPPAPNPARSSALTEFDLPWNSRVLLRVMDVQGREVARLADGDYAAGRHPVLWDLGANRTRPAAGVYFLRLEASGRVLTRRLAVVR
jgi:sugar lactone lactonase YvrE